MAILRQLPGYSLVVIGICVQFWCVTQALVFSGKLEERPRGTYYILPAGSAEIPPIESPAKSQSVFTVAPAFLNGLLHGGWWTAGVVAGAGVMILGMALVGTARDSSRREELAHATDYTKEDALKLFREVFGEGGINDQNGAGGDKKKTPPRAPR
jgi:hypothetical protein